jgi:hypothetical protein
MHGAKLPLQADLTGNHSDRNAARHGRTTRNFAAGVSARHCLGRASVPAACAVCEKFETNIRAHRDATG